MSGREILALMAGGYILRRNRFMFHLESERGTQRIELNQWSANGLWRNKQIERDGDHWVATAEPNPLDQHTKPTFKKYQPS